jgi:hypothetical protein
VPLDMNRRSIRGFRVAWAERMTGMREVVFRNAVFGGTVRVNQNLLLRGTLRFMGGARVSTPLLSLKARSFLLEITAPSAMITASIASSGAEINVMGETVMPALTADTLVFQNLDGRRSYRLSGDHLLIVLRSIYGVDLFANSIVLENGMLAGGDRLEPGYFAADYGLISLARGAQAVIYNTRTKAEPSPVTVAMPLDQGFELNAVVRRMDELNMRLHQRLAHLEWRSWQQQSGGQTNQPGRGRSPLSGVRGGMR